MEHQQPSHEHLNHPHNALIRLLLDCANTCEVCGSSCLDEQDVTPMAYCIELDRDCADICYLTARLLTRDSQCSHKLLAVCEYACNQCAEECSKHEHEHCKRCAEACRKCADACHTHLAK